jgi:hypothetical protein
VAKATSDGSEAMNPHPPAPLFPSHNVRCGRPWGRMARKSLSFARGKGMKDRGAWRRATARARRATALDQRGFPVLSPKSQHFRGFQPAHPAPCQHYVRSEAISALERPSVNGPNWPVYLKSCLARPRAPLVSLRRSTTKFRRVGFWWYYTRPQAHPAVGADAPERGLSRPLPLPLGRLFT